MATETTNYGLHKPVITDNVNSTIENLSSDMTVIDSQLKTRETEDATINDRIDNLILNNGDSSAEVVDARHSNVSDVTYTVLVDRLDAMEESSSVSITSSLPATPYSNQMVIDTNLDIFKYYDNGTASWKPLVAKNGVFYLEDTAVGTDAYKVNVSGLSLFTGVCVNLKVNTANTGACTFSIDNGSNYKSIVKGISTALETGDILANQIIQLVYNGTNWVLISNSYNNIVTINSNIGNLSSLITTDKTSIVNAINEIETEVANLKVVEEYTSTGVSTIAANDNVYITSAGYVAKCGAVSAKTNHETGRSAYTSSCKLSDNKILVAYQDADDSSKGKAIVIDFSTGVGIAGSATNFDTDTITYIGCTQIDTDKFMVAYNDGGDTKGKVIIGTVSGTAITFDTAVEFCANAVEYVSCCKLDTNKGMIAYNDTNAGGGGGAGGTGKVVVISITGTTPSIGIPVAFKAGTSGTAAYCSIAQVDTNKAIVAYKDLDASNYGYVNIISVTGTTPSGETRIAFESAVTNYIDICVLSTSLAFIAYADNGNSNYGTGIAITISGTTVVAGTAVVFESAATTNISVNSAGNGVIIAYTDGGNSSYGTFVIANINTGTTVTYNSPAVFSSVNSTYKRVGDYSIGRYIILNTDNANNTSEYFQIALDGDGIAQSAELAGSRKLGVSLF